MFVLHTVVDKYINSGSRLYATFIDFKKAFDMVPHIGMLLKLQKEGIKGRIYGLIKNMYLQVQPKLQVKVGNHLTNQFISQKGVRQGDVLSPVLFKLFLNDIHSYLDENCKPAKMGNLSINCLLYADDMVLLSESEDGLQRCMDKMAMYCREWDLTINYSKTKMMIFDKRGRKDQQSNLLYNSYKIEQVQSYKYLGYIFSANGNFKEANADRRNKGLKAAFKLMKIFKENAIGYKMGMHLFDRCIKPVLLYGSEIGCPIDKTFQKNWHGRLYNNSCNNDLEKTATFFYRYILGVKKHTPIVGIYGETGRYPLLIEAINNSLKFLLRIIKTENILLNAALAENIDLTKKGKPNWLKGLKELLSHMGLDNCFERFPPNLSQLENTIRSSNTILQNVFKTEWSKNLNKDKSKDGQSGNKLRSYRLFKTSYDQEQYLAIIHDPKIRKCYTKFRLSDHNLHIETGRHAPTAKRKPPCQRLCQHCSLIETEDEFHFFSKCLKYTQERQILYTSIDTLYPAVKDLPLHEKTIWLLGSSEAFIINKVAKYIFTCFKIRNS